MTGINISNILNVVNNYEDIKDSIGIHLINLKGSGDISGALVKKDCGIFTVTYRIILKEMDKGIYHISITEEMLERWNVTSGQLHEDALSNQVLCLYTPEDDPRDHQIDRAAESVLKGIPDGWSNAVDGADRAACIMTDASGIEGSSLIVNPVIMDDLCDQWGGSLLILPYSSARSMLIPYDEHAMELAVKIRDIIKVRLGKEELLSDQILLYSKESGLNVCDMQERNMED